MRRKLVRQGAATMMISLPAKWIKQNKLEKGSEVDLEQFNSQLVISAEAIEKKSETEISLLNPDESTIRTLITNAYRAGYDRIKVLFDSELKFKILTKIVKTHLIGFDIIKKEKGYCIVENITEPSEDQFDNILNKLFFSIGELFEITEKRFENSREIYDYEEVEERILKYDNFCRRIISKKKMESQKSEFFWTFLALLMHSQRELYFVNSLLDRKIKISEKTRTLLGGAEQAFGLVKKAYSEKNISHLYKIHELQKDLIYQKGHAMLQEKKGKELLVVYHLLICIRQLYHTKSPLFGLII